MTDVSFPDAVAERSGHPVADVTRVLAEARIPTSDTVGAPHRLRVTRLAFTGKKAGLLTDDIDFDQEFSSGLWAVTSQRNDAGKTSILEIIMWCLRGHPKKLQHDVKAWLHTVTLEGTVDDDPFIVEFDVTEGMPTGALTCGTDVRPFASDAAFADTMSQFMMERLGFDTFQLWVEGQGVATHEWPSYSTVLYLPREAEGAVIGDMAGTGVAQRLVQLFVGIRWARTYSACQAVWRQAQSEAANRDEEQETLQRVASSTVTAKRSELDTVKIKMAALPSGLPSEADIAAANGNWMALITQHANAVSDHHEAEREAKAAQRRATRERKRLADNTEAALARRLFHGLDPAKCPRCSTDIGPDRKQAEKTNHACAVCDRELDLDLDVEIDDTPIDAEEADEAQSTETLQQLVADLEALAAAEKQRAAILAGQVSTLAGQLRAAETLVETYSNMGAQVDQRRALESQAAALEAVIAELGNLTGDALEPPPPPPEDNTKLAIFQAAMDEAKARRGAGFSEVVDEVNAAILDLARRFGFATLEEAKLSLNAQLRLVKGGTATSFSYQTPGEKLRLRIAVVVGLLRVAHKFGVGRHPGLLLIDSIGAEETEPGNLAEFMRELEAVTAELGIQTIVASARPEILAHVPANQQLSVTGDGYLW
jgi:hypothetical protein